MNDGPIVINTSESSLSQSLNTNEVEVNVIEYSESSIAEEKIISQTVTDGNNNSTTTIIAEAMTTTTPPTVKLDLSESLDPNNPFQPYVLYEAFMSCLVKSSPVAENFDDVSLRSYLIAYSEIAKFLYNLGNIFYFVIADLRKKIGQLECYLMQQPDEYETFQRMVKYEWASGKLHKPVSLNKQNATRIVLRLHRALIFIIRLLERVFYAESHLRVHQLCCEAYESTLAKYHSWLVRRAATFGMRALPKREILIGYMLKNEEDFEKFPEFIRTVDSIYNVTQNIYERYGILELP